MVGQIAIGHYPDRPLPRPHHQSSPSKGLGRGVEGTGDEVLLQTDFGVEIVNGTT